jgi:hypothetical protein
MKNTHHPLRVADWLLFLLISRDQAPPILGDLREEFSAVASRRGMWPARLWYWRQVAKTVPHLFYSQLALEPWRVFSAVVAGLLLLALAYMPLYAVLLRWYPADWPEWLRLAWLCLPYVQPYLPPMVVGWIVARASKRRDIIVTIVFSFATFLMGVIPWLIHFSYGPAEVSHLMSVRSLLWLAHPYAAIVAPIGTFIGGLIARKMAPALAAG